MATVVLHWSNMTTGKIFWNPLLTLSFDAVDSMASGVEETILALGSYYLLYCRTVLEWLDWWKGL
jgi:hypothetical protein